MTPADLSCASPLLAAQAVRAQLEAACRDILGRGYEAWRLRQAVESLAARLVRIERDESARRRFVAGGSLTKSKGNTKRVKARLVGC